MAPGLGEGELTPTPWEPYGAELSPLDMRSALKAARAISEEIELDRVVERVLNQALENAGAERALLVLTRDGVLHLEAEVMAGGALTRLEPPLRLRDLTSRLPVGLVRYVVRSGEPLVLGDASTDAAFQDDHYITSRRIRSVLCVPIVNRAVPIGALYFENNLSAGVFASDRMEVIRLLSAQAAISLENARLYAAVRDRDERYRATFQRATDIILVLDQHTGEILEANPATERALGRGALAGHNVRELLASSGGAPMPELLAAGAEDAAPFDLCFQAADGARLDVEVGACGAALGGRDVLIWIARDVTDANRQAGERERLLNTLSNTNRALESLLRVTSHDLRTPLVNIEGFGHELRAACDDLLARLASARQGEDVLEALACVVEEEMLPAVRTIRRNAGRMDRLLSGLSQFTRLGRTELVPQALDMTALVRGLAEGMRFQLEGRAEVRVGELPTCWGDEDLIARVFGNLLDNAVKYMPPGRAGIIEVSGAVVASRATYCVADNGNGVPAAYQNKVFEIFHRLDPRGDVGGEGLGLTIIRRIVDRHDGRVWLESDAGGARFYVALPAAPDGT